MSVTLRRWLGRATPVAPSVDLSDGEGVVRVSTAGLIALHHGADALTLSPRVIRSTQAGSYRSPFKGRGMEFDEARPYAPGDDVRTIDWRVTARSGRTHTKLFREERERSVLLAIDLRHAMFFATRGAFKAVRAAQAAALLGWSALHHGDRTGAMLFAEGLHQELRPRRGKAPLMHLFKQLAAPTLWERGGNHADPGAAADALHDTLARLRRVAPPGSLIFVLSDFSQLDERGEAHLKRLGRNNDLVLLFHYDALEAALPDGGLLRVSDGERFARFDSHSATFRGQYQARFAQRREILQQLSRTGGMHLIEMPTGVEPLVVLQRALEARRR